jgi:hypothetical protein
MGIFLCKTNKNNKNNYVNNHIKPKLNLSNSNPFPIRTIKNSNALIINTKHPPHSDPI